MARAIDNLATISNIALLATCNALSSVFMSLGLLSVSVALRLSEDLHRASPCDSVVDLVLVAGRRAPRSNQARADNTPRRPREVLFTGTALLRSRTAAQYHGSSDA